MSRFGSNPVNLMSSSKWCPIHEERYYSLECPVCNKYAPKEYQVEQARLSNIRQAINFYFTRPDIGMHALDQIVSHCLSLAQVIDHLSNYDEGSIEYYMQRAKIVRMIQGQIEAYIDNKLEPQ
jgi:hypothetical protein